MKNLILLSALALVAMMTPPPAIPAGTYKLDKTHSNVGFNIRHLGISNVRGKFNESTVRATVGATGLRSLSVEATIDIKSIDTNNSGRDNHLKGTDFFDAEQFPTATFRSTRVTPNGNAGRFTMQGNLTLKGVTRPLTLRGTYNGTITNQRGTKIGFDVTGSINRQNYGITYSNLTIGDNVNLVFELELDKE